MKIKHNHSAHTSDVQVMVAHYWHNDDVKVSPSEIEHDDCPHAVPFVQTDAGRSSSKRSKQKNDCTVRAWATANHIPYDEAYDVLKSFGRKSGRGIDFKGFANTQINIVSRISFPAVKGKKRMNIGKFCNQYDKGIFIIKTAKHVSAVLDGVVHDTFEPRHDRCVYAAYALVVV